ncbi:MAG: nucleotide exchange factor GrpE [Sphingobacteriales bacterium]|nr:MAG: nucleotide exchange factor GrpE [Sphingobacteriales bacterium]
MQQEEIKDKISDNEALDNNDSNHQNDENCYNDSQEMNLDEDLDQNEKLKTELADTKDKYLRLFAEFDNFKKRSAKEKREYSLVVGQDIIKDLLPVLDDIKRANANYVKDNNAETFAQGAQLIFEKFTKVLQQKGLKEIESIGKDFDVEQQEAIAEIPAPNEEFKGKVLDEVEAGYTLNGTIIRYAKVVVGK